MLDTDLVQVWWNGEEYCVYDYIEHAEIRVESVYKVCALVKSICEKWRKQCDT